MTSISKGAFARNGRKGGASLTFVLALAVSGCATPPDKLETQYVSPERYASHDCAHLTAEMERASRRIDELYLSLKDEATTDAAQMGVGLVLFWPALLFLEGGDGPQAAEYSRLKGEYQALEKVATQKRCEVPATARAAKWASSARNAAAQSCNSLGSPRLVSSTGTAETYEVGCGQEPSQVVHCQGGSCRVSER